MRGSTVDPKLFLRSKLIDVITRPNTKRFDMYLWIKSTQNIGAFCLVQDTPKNYRLICIYGHISARICFSRLFRH